MISDHLWQLLAADLPEWMVRDVEYAARRLVRAYPRFVCPVALGVSR